MVEVKPFRGRYYDVKKIGDIRNVVAPPHDVISEKERDGLYSKSQYNIVRIILPKEGESEAVKTLKEMESNDILRDDEKEAFYVYEQEFDYLGKRVRRAGLLTQLKANPIGTDVLPHEQVFPEKVEERLKIQQACGVDTSPIMAVYDDKGGNIRRLVDAAKKSTPLFEFEEGGVTNRIWPIYDTDEIIKHLKERRVIIADGHHRYTAASIMAQNGGPKYTLVYLMDINDPAMLVLPTHRFLNGDGFDLDGFIIKAAEYFDITEVNGIHELELMINKSGKHTFGVHTKDKSYALKLKDPKVLEKFMDGSESRTLKELDTSVLNKLILETICGINYDDASFAKHKDDVIRLIDNCECNVAFLLRHSSVAEVAQIAKNRERMPKKSTYFYPKPFAGVIICRSE